LLSFGFIVSFVGATTVKFDIVSGGGGYFVVRAITVKSMWPVWCFHLSIYLLPLGTSVQSNKMYRAKVLLVGSSFMIEIAFLIG
jgi:hypothetical protein